MKKVILFIFCLSIFIACNDSYNEIYLNIKSAADINIPGYDIGNYGYIIYDVSSDRVVLSHNPDKGFVPASVTKLFTAVFTAENLGYDYKFKTQLRYSGKISNGILSGNIYLIGGGDPEFSVNCMLEMINVLHEKGIKKVNGHFYYIDSIFTGRQMLDIEMPVESFYNPGISPLSFNDNNIFALLRKDGNKVRSVDFIPPVPSWDYRLYPGELRYPYTRFKHLNGREIWELPESGLWRDTQVLPVKNPSLYTSEVLRMLCGIRGIHLPIPESGEIHGSTEVLAVITSRPLADIIKEMLVSSSNLTAEILFSTATSETGTGPDAKIGNSAMIKKFYKNILPSVNWDNFNIVNGSGLTVKNITTPAQTAAVLLLIEKYRKENIKLEEVLPLSGWSGTMKSRLDKKYTAMRVYAKTGTLFYATALSGLFYSASGKKYIFSIYINDIKLRNEYNKTVVKTAGDINRGAEWNRKAADAVDDFLSRLVKEL